MMKDNEGRGRKLSWSISRHYPGFRQTQGYHFPSKAK